MTKIINKFGQEVDDYDTAYKFAKDWKAPDTDLSVTEARKPHELKDGKFDSSRSDKDIRITEFLSCLGNGKSIYEIEAEEEELE